MRELKVVGLDVDGKHIICEGDDPSEKFMLRARRPAACRRARRPGPARARPRSTSRSPSVLRPKEIQARIRAGASVEQVAAAAGVDVVTGRAVRPSGAAGALARRRAGNRRASGARRRARGADAAGNRHHRAGRARPRPRRHATGTPGATRTAAGPCRWPGRPACPTTSRTSGSPRARTAAPSPRSTTPPAS